MSSDTRWLVICVTWGVLGWSSGRGCANTPIVIDVTVECAESAESATPAECAEPEESPVLL